MINLKKEVLSTIKEYSLINKDENIVIGVSGGPDSMALLYVLLEIKDEIDFNIHIAHINHGVRGEAADKDQLFVERVAKQLNLPYYTKNVDMILYGKEHGISAEEAGRELRYGFFREILQNCGGGKIAVAHNMNDQAETLLMRFFRGTGVDGLKGMEFILGDIIRPILGISRKEIEDYIEINNIETVLDHTNLMPIYTRNKVRLELIPYIEENFNPNIINTLWRTSSIAMTDSNFLEKYSKERYNEVVKKRGKDSIILDGKKFLEEDRSIQQRIIRNTILEISNSLQGISEAQISNILNLFLASETGKECHISSNLIAKTSYENFIIEKNTIKEEMDYLYDINLEGITNVKELGYSFDTSIITKEQFETSNKLKGVRYFDFDSIKGDLKIRNRKHGDRIVPFGMSGTKKIKDYFIDEKIPKELRDSIPILVDDENILWVVGYRTSEKYKVTINTKRVLVIKYNLEKI